MQLSILKQFIQPTWGLNRGPADNRLGFRDSKAWTFPLASFNS